jgi:NAD-dependent deacetylase
MLKEMLELIIKAKPNAAHRGLTLMEEVGLVNSVITQNVDDRHEAAGSKNVIEFRGTHRLLSRLDCGLTREVSMSSLQQLPTKCPNCETLLKPDVILFGEPISGEAYAMVYDEAQSCDLVLVLGAFAGVPRAADIPRLAKVHGASVAGANLDETFLTRDASDYSILGSCATTIPEIVKRVRAQRELQER